MATCSYGDMAKVDAFLSVWRREQAKVLAGAIAEVRAEEAKNAVVGADFNRRVKGLEDA